MSADVIFLYGPPFSGRTLYYKQHLSDRFELVVPDEIYQKDQDLTIRQLIQNYIVDPLKQGSKIVIDDSFKTSNKRKSYLRLIKKKAPHTVCDCYKFVPQYGSDQIYWAREFLVAEWTGGKNQDLLDGRLQVNIENWFCTGSGSEIPDDKEGFNNIKHISWSLKAQCDFQFEVPALFIQWEATLTNTDHPELMAAFQEVIEIWYTANPCGRVLLIAEEYHSSGAASEKAIKISKLLKEFIKQICCPVYLLLIQRQLTTDDYLIPPKPGILAYLQRLHCLDLFHPGTLYLYHTIDHMKMAASTGLKYIKGSRLFIHPKLARSNHAATQTKPLAMLLNVDVIPYHNIDMGKSVASDRAQIPLYREMLTADDNCVVHRVTIGRTLYAFVKDAETLQKYQGEYQSNATLSSTKTPSRILQLYKQSLTPCLRKHQLVAQQSSHVYTRKLPEWMLSEGSKKNKDTLMQQKADASNTLKMSPHNHEKTVYVMSADELIEAAKLILLEAGESVPSDEEIQTYLNRDDDIEDKVHRKSKAPQQKSNSSLMNNTDISQDLTEKDSYSTLNLELTLSETDGSDSASPQVKKRKQNEQSVNSFVAGSMTNQIRREQCSEDISMVGNSLVSCFVNTNQNTKEYSNSKCEGRQPALLLKHNKLDDPSKPNLDTALLGNKEQSRKYEEHDDGDNDEFSILDGLI